MVQLLKHRCLPILLYALEVFFIYLNFASSHNKVCNLLQSLDFTVNRFFMKLFGKSNI